MRLRASDIPGPLKAAQCARDLQLCPAIGTCTHADPSGMIRLVIDGRMSCVDGAVSGCNLCMCLNQS